MSPVLIGLKKSTESVEAVTTCAPACFVAEIGAISSILPSKNHQTLYDDDSYLVEILVYV